jgi:hypothetical protein
MRLTTCWMIRDSDPAVRDKRFISPKCWDQFQGPHGCLLDLYGDSFPGVEWLGCEVDCLPPSSAAVKNNSLYAFMVCIGTPLPFTFVLSWEWCGRMINPVKYFCTMSPKGSLLFAVILMQQWSFLAIYILCFLSLSNCFCFSEAENIQELNYNLNVKQRELTTLETNRRHQKEALRRREEDLRGTSKNLISI